LQEWGDYDMTWAYSLTNENLAERMRRVLGVLVETGTHLRQGQSVVVKDNELVGKYDNPGLLELFMVGDIDVQEHLEEEYAEAGKGTSVRLS
jgi:hypothetical protein